MDYALNMVAISSIFFLLDMVIVWKTFINRKMNIKTMRFFFLSFFTAILQLCATGIVVYQAKMFYMPNWVGYILFMLSICLLCAPPYFSLNYLVYVVNEKVKISLLNRAITIFPWALLVIVTLISPFTHLVFYINDEGIYSRGILFMMQFICPCSYFLIATLLLLYSLKHRSSVNYRRLIGHYLAFVIPVFIGILILVAFHLDGLNYIVVGISIGMICLFIERYMSEMQENERLKGIQEVNEKLSEANRIQKYQLDIVEALSSDFTTVSLIDTKDGTSTPFKMINVVKEITSFTIGEKHFYQPAIDSYIKKRFHPEDQIQMLKQSKLEYVVEMLKKQEEFTGNFRILDYDKSIHYYQFKYKKIKDSSLIILGYQNVDSLIEEEKNKNAELEKMNTILSEKMDIIQSMATIYFSSFYVNIRSNSFIEIADEEFVRKEVGITGNAQEALFYVADHMIKEEYKEGYRTFVDFKTVNERMVNKRIITYDYEGNKAGWCQISIIEGKRDFKGNLEAILIAVRTIHDEKEREELQNKKLSDALKQAEDASAAKTSFLFNMSHDIRTPMNAIIGFTELLEKNQSDKERRHEYLEKIKESSGILLSILNNVLEMARIEKGTIVLDEKPLNIYFFDESLSLMFSEMMKEKNIEYHSETKITHPYVYADSSRLKEIFMNILSNAYKYTNDGGRVSIRILEIECEKENHATYQISVSDTGIGMAKDFIPHLFDEFARERNSTSSRIEGTGLGMAIVKRLIDTMHGDIQVESELGVGSTFTVTLTNKLASKDDFIETKPIQITKDVFEGKRLLLAEDNDFNAEIAIELLKEYGFIIDRVKDGKECFDAIQKEKANTYQCILMDIQMPNVNGYEATNMIRSLSDKKKSRIPILAMTANAFEEDKTFAVKAGMNGHISKPIEIKDMLKEISRVLS